MKDEAGSPPVRLLVRYLAEYLFQAGARWIDLTETDSINTTLLRLTLSANLAKLPIADESGFHGLDSNPAEPRPLIVSAAAHALGLPFETVRRRAMTLKRLRLLDGDRRGLTAIAPLAAWPGFAAFIAGEGAAFRAMAAEIVEAYDPEGRVAGAIVALGALPPTVVARIANDYSSQCAENFFAAHGNVTAALVLNGMIAANVRPLLSNPVLSRRFGTEDAPPPDELREPVAIRTLARELGLPFETVRRQVQALAVTGAMESRGRRGWIVPVRHLTGKEFTDRNRRLVRLFFRSLDRVTRLVAERDRLGYDPR